MWIFPKQFTIADGNVMYTNRPINSDHIVTFDEHIEDVVQPIDVNIDKSNHASGHHVIHEASKTVVGGHVGHPLLNRFPAIQFKTAQGENYYWFYKSTKDRDEDLTAIENELKKSK